MFLFKLNLIIKDKNNKCVNEVAVETTQTSRQVERSKRGLIDWTEHS